MRLATHIKRWWQFGIRITFSTRRAHHIGQVDGARMMLAIMRQWLKVNPMTSHVFLLVAMEQMEDMMDRNGYGGRHKANTADFKRHNAVGAEMVRRVLKASHDNLEWAAKVRLRETDLRNLRHQRDSHVLMDMIATNAMTAAEEKEVKDRNQ